MNDKILKIIDSVRYATISTVDTNNNPWAAPVWYVYDDDTIYWWSPIESQHSKNIEHNPNVYITIFDSTVPEGDGLGVYISAVASEVESDLLGQVIDLYNTSTKIFKLNPENTSGNAPTRLYKAVIKSSWINSSSETNGAYTDTRISS